MKVVWDGRMDFIELWSTYNVSIGKNVCDLQVAEVLSRSNFRGERDDERLSRLATYFGPQVWKNPLQFMGIHRVVGLQQCLEDNGYSGLVGKDRESLPSDFLCWFFVLPGRVLTQGSGLFQLKSRRCTVRTTQRCGLSDLFHGNFSVTPPPIYTLSPSCTKTSRPRVGYLSGPNSSDAAIATSQCTSSLVGSGRKRGAFALALSFHLGY